MQAAAQWVAQRCTASDQSLRLLIVATGFLHGDAGQPERSFINLDAAYLQQVFAINTLGPALVMKHFLPLLPKQGRCVAGFISAKVGSIGDNRLGGWYSYRASKAALNMLLKTAAIEVARTHPQAVLAALHPGTVDSALSRPFGGERIGRPAPDAAADLLSVLDGLPAEDSGSFHSYRGERLPW